MGSRRGVFLEAFEPARSSGAGVRSPPFCDRLPALLSCDEDLCHFGKEGRVFGQCALPCRGLRLVFWDAGPCVLGEAAVCSLCTSGPAF